MKLDQFDFFRRLGQGFRQMENAKKAELYDAFMEVENRLAERRAELMASKDVDNIMASPGRTRQYIALTMERMTELEQQLKEAQEKLQNHG